MVLTLQPIDDHYPFRKPVLTFTLRLRPRTLSQKIRGTGRCELVLPAVEDAQPGS